MHSEQLGVSLVLVAKPSVCLVLLVELNEPRYVLYRVGLASRTKLT